LRCIDGRFKRGKLQVISITGGLLSLTKPLDFGSRVKLMFLSGTGTIFGQAEMLSPISWSLQPFKFLRLYEDDEERLQSAIQSSLSRSRSGYGMMERIRPW
jgi:hypothetical protein